MIEKLKAFMKKKYNYELNEYKVCYSQKKKSKFIFWPSFLLIIVVAIYITQLVNLIPTHYDVIVIVITSMLLVIVQGVVFGNNKIHSLVITPKYIVKCIGKRSLIVIDFDEIKQFRVNKNDGLAFSDQKNEISISLVRFQNDLEPIIDILEAKGKTFDKSRDYMKRPIEISIVNDEIIIKDVKPKISSTEKIVGEYYNQFKMLTPGFIRDIIFFNSIVENVTTSNNNLILNLNKFEVKEGHPENTGFDPIVATDCIIIFENINIKYIHIENVANRNSKEEILPNEIDSIISNVKKGVISNWKYRKNGIDLHFGVEMQLLKASFDYKEVIIGWNDFK